jgi:non-specific riboncleoside hydrolase
MFSFYQDGNIQKGITMHDVCTIAYLANKEMFSCEKMNLNISCASEDRAKLYQDDSQNNNISIAMDLNQEMFIDWINPLLESL